MKKPIFYAIWAAVSALQIALLCGTLLLSRLAYTRGGVNHHVAHRKRQYNTLIFTTDNIPFMQAGLILIAALLICFFLRNVRRGKREDAILIGFCFAIDAVLFFELTAPAFRSISIYPYAVLVTAIIFALELILVVLRAFVREAYPQKRKRGKI